MAEHNSYQMPVILAISLHVLLLAVLFIDMQSPIKQPALTHADKKVDIVKAVTVNQDQVEAEIARIKQQQAKKKQAELEQQKRLQEQAQAAKRQREAEQRRLAKIKQQLQQEQAKQRAEAQAAAKKLAALKKQQEQEAQRLAKIKQQKQALAKKQAAEAKRLAKIEAQRKAQAEKERQQAAAEAAKQAAAARAQQAAMQREVDKYKALIVEAISQHWIVPDNANKDLSARLAIRLAPGGTVLSVSLVKSSGDPVLDRSAQAAVYKASPLPVPSEPQAFAQFRNISLTVRPERVLSDG